MEVTNTMSSCTMKPLERTLDACIAQLQWEYLLGKPLVLTLHQLPALCQHSRIEICMIVACVLAAVILDVLRAVGSVICRYLLPASCAGGC